MSLRNNSWKEKGVFSGYDVIFHVAGIAHVSSDPKMEDIYYKVNRDLTFEVAKKAKDEGVKQFIFMSSIIVYGDSVSHKKIINIDTVPNPSNFYGDSKLQAEESISPLENEEFKIVIVRPPMIYGKGSKGNYPKISKLAQRIILFPDFNNERSMIHIDNLCEFIRVIIDNEKTGTFFPQNNDYVKTSDLVKTISKIHGKRIWMTSLFNPVIKMMFKISIINKVFGNLVYEKSLSRCDGMVYCIRSFEESIALTELETEK